MISRPAIRSRLLCCGMRSPTVPQLTRVSAVPIDLGDARIGRRMMREGIAMVSRSTLSRSLGWALEPGRFELHAGRSSRNLRLTTELAVDGAG